MKSRPCLFSPVFGALWLCSMVAAVLSGLAHLPLAWRYGLIPWNGKATVVHYWAAAALLLLGTYACMVWWARGRRLYSLTRCGRVRGVFLGLLAASGLALVLHNLPDFSVYGVAYSIIKIGHLVCALALLPVFAFQWCARAVGGYGWFRPRGDTPLK